MRYIGLDCSSVSVGWSIVDANGPALTRIDSGVWDISRSGQAMPDRLVTFDRFLTQIMARFGPCSMVVETSFMGVNAQSSLRIAEVRGVALLHAGHAAIPVRNVAPASVKKLIGGHGRAKKDEVAEGVRAHFPGEVLSFATDDESDALAIAAFGAIKDNDEQPPE